MADPVDIWEQLWFIAEAHERRARHAQSGDPPRPGGQEDLWSDPGGITIELSALRWRQPARRECPAAPPGAG